MGFKKKLKNETFDGIKKKFLEYEKNKIFYFLKK